MFSPIWGKGNGRGISGFAVNRGAVNRGFTVLYIYQEAMTEAMQVLATTPAEADKKRKIEEVSAETTDETPMESEL